MTSTFPACRAVSFAAYLFLFHLLADCGFSQVNSTNIAGSGNNLQVTASNAAIISGLSATNGGTNSAIIGAANSIVPGGTRFAFIGAGNFNNMAAGSHSAAMIGGFSNTISAGAVRGATIGGGFNTNAGRSAVILGGELNIIGINSTGAAVVGGYDNIIDSNSFGASIGGGQSNTIAAGATNAVIGGGDRNTANGRLGTIAGGYINTISNVGSTIGGGGRNTTASDWATVVGGYSNTASGYAGAVGGGWQNKASGSRATVAGGQLNTNGGPYSFIGGGVSNVVVESESFVSSHATIGGGLGNFVNTLSSYATISGGAANSANAAYAVIGGGGANSNSSLYGVIGGGLGNYAEGEYNTVAGGYLNRIDQYDAVPNYATVSGGFNNRANGQYATVPGGYMNEAVGDYSFAAGRRAVANMDGAFVWADSQDQGFSPLWPDSFNVRANGGVRFLTSDAGTGFSVTTPGVSFNSSTNSSVRVSWYQGDSDWTFTSDAASKENFRDVDPRDMLRRVAALPITEWNYIGYTQRNIGPTAQDWQKAFSELSRSDKSINSGHMQGVALAAIKGLAEELQERDKAIKELKAQNEQLSRKIESIDQRLNSLPPAP